MRLTDQELTEIRQRAEAKEPTACSVRLLQHIDALEAECNTTNVGDVVQILDTHNDDGTRGGWVGAFVLVEVKAWGIQGFVHAIQQHSESARIYIRLKWEHIKKIGRAEMVPQDVEVAPRV